MNVEELQTTLGRYDWWVENDVADLTDQDIHRLAKAARLVADPNFEQMKKSLHALSVAKPDPDTAVRWLWDAALTPGDTE